MRLVRTMHPEAVALTRKHARQVGMPHIAIHLGKVNSPLRALIVDQAQIHTGGDLRENREIHSCTVVGGPERIGVTRPNIHDRPSDPCSSMPPLRTAPTPVVTMATCVARPLCCISTWTPSSPRSSSGTSRRCVESRSLS